MLTISKSLRRSKEQRTGSAIVAACLSLICFTAVGPGVVGVVHGADLNDSHLGQHDDDDAQNPIIGEATRLERGSIVVDDQSYELASDVQVKTQGGRSLLLSQLSFPTQVRLRFRGETVVSIEQGVWPR